MDSGGLVVCCGENLYISIEILFLWQIQPSCPQGDAGPYEWYNQEFELLSIEFETKEVETGGAKYVHIWTFTLRDSQGRQFHVYDRIFGLIEKGEELFSYYWWNITRELQKQDK